MSSPSGQVNGTIHVDNSYSVDLINSHDPDARWLVGKQIKDASIGTDSDGKTVVYAMFEDGTVAPWKESVGWAPHGLQGLSTSMVVAASQGGIFFEKKGSALFMSSLSNAYADHPSDPILVGKNIKSFRVGTRVGWIPEVAAQFADGSTQEWVFGKGWTDLQGGFGTPANGVIDSFFGPQTSQGLATPKDEVWRHDDNNLPWFRIGIWGQNGLTEPDTSAQHLDAGPSGSFPADNPLQSLAPGSVVNGSLKQAGHVNVFRLHAGQSQRLDIRVSPAAFLPSLSPYQPGDQTRGWFRVLIYDAAGRQLIASKTGFNLTEFQTTAGADYTVVVNTWDGGWTGDYTLFVEGGPTPAPRFQPQTVSAPSHDYVTGATYPGLAFGSIDYRGQYDLYRLQPISDHQLVVRMQPPPAPHYSNPGSGPVQSGGHGIPTGGGYVPSTHASDGPDSSGNIGPKSGDGSHGVPPGRQNPTGSGAPPSAGITDPLTSPVVMVYDAGTGALVAKGFGQTPSFRASAGHTYTIVVGGGDNQFTGAYDLLVEDAGQPVPHQRQRVPDLAGLINGRLVADTPVHFGTAGPDPGLGSALRSLGAAQPVWFDPLAPRAVDAVWAMSGTASAAWVAVPQPQRSGWQRTLAAHLAQPLPAVAGAVSLARYNRGAATTSTRAASPLVRVPASLAGWQPGQLGVRFTR